MPRGQGRAGVRDKKTRWAQPEGEEQPHAFHQQSAGGQLLGQLLPSATGAFKRANSSSTLFAIHRLPSLFDGQTDRQFNHQPRPLAKEASWLHRLPQTNGRLGSWRSLLGRSRDLEETEGAVPCPDAAEIVLQGDWDKWLHKARGTWSTRHVAVTNDALCISFQAGGEVRDLLTLTVKDNHGLHGLHPKPLTTTP